jgi:hypothetical protein
MKCVRIIVILKEKYEKGGER